MDDLLLRGGIVAGTRRDLAIDQGHIRQIAPHISTPARTTLDIAGKLVLPGFVESHIHPDKAFIAERTSGLRQGGPTPQVLVAELKKTFSVADIYERARRVMLGAIRHGCTSMRAHVEIDAFVELRGVEALQRVQAEFAGVLDLQLIAFAQEGIFHDDVTQGLLREGLQMGLPTLGGCPYMDEDQCRHIDWFFETAEAAGVPLDFHADSGDDPSRLTCDYIAEQTIARGMQGRVTLGHLCTLDVLEPDRRARVIDTMRRAGIRPTVAIDLEDEPCPAGGSSPALARPVSMPRTVHAQMCPELETAVESDQQVLALCLDGIDPLADHPLDLRDRPRTLRPRRDDVPPDQVRPETLRGAEERVALRHRGPVLAR